MTYSICLLVFALSGTGVQTTEDEQLKSQVEYFNIKEGFAGTFSLNFVDKFIELVDDQRKEIDEIMKRHYLSARTIIEQSSPGLAERYDLLVKLREKQNDEIRRVLLPEQIDRLESYRLYSDIKGQGFAHSIVNGSLVIQLGLSDKERIEVNRAIKQASDEYRDRLIKAQKQAIRGLRESLPNEKREKLDEYLKPLLASNGTFWKIDLSMFDTNNPVVASHYLFFGIPNVNTLSGSKPGKDK